MFDKDMLQKMQQQMKEIKDKLDTITVQGTDGQGAVKVTASGNREIKSIEISEELKNGDPEELQDTLVVATNRALEQAKKVEETEMQGKAQDIMPFFPGMG